MVSTELNIYSSGQFIEIPFYLLNARLSFMCSRFYWVYFELRLLLVDEIYSLCTSLKRRLFGPMYVIVQFLRFN